MKEYQFYTTSEDGSLMHAGVHKLGRVCRKTIVKIERKWMAWRYEYVKTHPGKYPLSEDTRPPAKIYLFPIDSPSQIQSFVL